MAKKIQQSKSPSRVSRERIENAILLIRGQKVMLDRDLADLYAVKAIALRQQVKRNMERFPDDFMFQLHPDEADELVSQNVIPTKRSLGGTMPYVFTQEGVAMLSSVLRSGRAVEVNIEIMRAFVRLRELIASHKTIAAKLQEMEQRLARHDDSFRLVFESIRQLLQPPTKGQRARRIGFQVPEENDS